MPTAAISTWTPSNRLEPYVEPDQAPLINVALGNSLTLAKGTILGEVTATPGVYRAYAAGNVDGSQKAAVILSYTVTTDGSGNITIEGEWGATRKAAPVYIGGYFATADLTGLDANAVTVMGG